MLGVADYVLLAVLLVSMGIGLWRGFLVEVLSLTVWIGAFWLAVAFGDTVAAWLAGVESAAARGVLNSGGTLTDILNYGQNAASQEYQDIWNRKYNEFDVNQFKPWTTFASAAQRQNELDYSNAYDAWRNGGPAAVRRYGGVPPFSETQTYVRRVLAGMGGN